MTLDSPLPSEPRRILVVEDYTDLALLLRIGIERAGFIVESVATCQEAIMRSLTGSFDLLVCDIMLPDGMGWDIVPHWKARQLRPAIAISAMDSSSTSRTSLARGFDRYMAKPFALAALIEMIQELLKNRA
jgi:DNA-binding response OmpR family regulator